MAPPDAGAPVVDRDSVERFLRTCIETFASEATRKQLKNCSSIRPGQKISEVQNRIWKDLGVHEQAGRQAVHAVEKNFPDDHASLVALREEFSNAVDEAYLRCLEDRRPSSLEKRAKMERATVLEFLDASWVMVETPAVKDRLRESIKATGAMPEATVNEVHGEVMELLGFERQHGLRCFEALGASNAFENDREVASAFARWRGKNSSVCVSLLREFKNEGGQLTVDEEVRNKLIVLQAKEDLENMSFEERSTVLEKNAKKVNVVKKLPLEARKRHLEKLGEQEKLEFTQCEILMSTLVQSQGWQDKMAKEATERAEQKTE